MPTTLSTAGNCWRDPGLTRYSDIFNNPRVSSHGLQAASEAFKDNPVAAQEHFREEFLIAATDNGSQPQGVWQFTPLAGAVVSGKVYLFRTVLQQYEHGHPRITWSQKEVWIGRDDHY